MYAKIIVEYSVKKLDKCFIYKVPKNIENTIKVGMKVLVPFKNQEIVGFVLELINNIGNINYEIKDIKDIIDEDMILNEELLNLGKYISDTTLCSLISAYQVMLPSSFKIKKGKHNYNIYDELVYLKDEVMALNYKDKYLSRRKAQVKIIDELYLRKEVNKKEFNYATLKELIKEDIVGIKYVQKYRINKSGNNVVKTLTVEQNRVYENIVKSFGSYSTTLLYGVTGSGKTEVYIKLIKEIIKDNKSAICLVPEISLTTQIANRFYESFGSDVAILHSSLSNGEKYDEYLKIYRGEVKVVVGTRSAIFAPLKNLGIIIIDEEDATSYKQDNNPRYHARDVAIYRAKYNNIPLILGSATPSLDTRARAYKKVYKMESLLNRVGSAKMPKIHIVNMVMEMKKKNVIFSDLLKSKIREKLDLKEQVILLLNRRGYSTFVTCSNCGFNYKCPNCDITLTYHKSTNNLICHYCGFQHKKDNVCPKCREDALNYYGLGTEKLEQSLSELFKDAKILRMDQDSTRNKGMHEVMINSFKNGEYDILIGTQMVSKGLDFPNVTLVGVINADITLNIPSYTSSEATFALLSQVSGRSGRSNKLGEVIIQTFNHDNYVIKCVEENNYDKFYLQEMNFRHKLKYPPYYYLVSLRVIGKDYFKTVEDSKNASNYLKDNLDKNIIILGPTTASIFRFNNEYRMQIIIKYKKEYNLKKVLKELDNMFIDNKNSYLEIDFNPTRI